MKNPWPTPGSSVTSFDPLLVTRMSGKVPPVKFPTTVETGPEPPEFSRGPAENEMAPPFCDWLSRIDTWLEPSSATTRSGRRRR